MTADVIRLFEAPSEDDGAALLAAIGELHALVMLDPTLGASPARAYFVLNPAAQARIVECLDRQERAGGRSACAYALVAYDVPFARLQLSGVAAELTEARAQVVIEASAAVQGEALAAAARALGLAARRFTGFDAAALKATFFPNTQERVVAVLQISLAGG